MALLDIKGLVKTYSSRRVVDGVDFQVGAGEIVGLLGPNGAGKTTTFRIVMGIIKSEAGTVKLMDEDITRLPMFKRARHGMGYLSQEPSIFRNMTVEDNVMSILETQNLSRSARRERLMELLSDMNLGRLSRSIAHTLSGGERRRLEICRALVASPSILLLDEPFSGVDPKACEDIQKIIYSLQERGISILITDHNVFETFTIVDRAYIIRNGKVLKHGSPSELVEDPEARRLYLGDKFSEYGDAFKHLRDEVRRKGKEAPIIKIGASAVGAGSAVNITTTPAASAGAAASATASASSVVVDAVGAGETEGAAGPVPKTAAPAASARPQQRRVPTPPGSGKKPHDDDDDAGGQLVGEDFRIGDR